VNCEADILLPDALPQRRINCDENYKIDETSGGVDSFYLKATAGAEVTLARK
jgi:hypothetical protein